MFFITVVLSALSAKSLTQKFQLQPRIFVFTFCPAGMTGMLFLKARSTYLFII
jgi:hypothetical protein